MSVVLAFTDLGGAGRPPLLLLHGMLGSARNWQTAGRDLAAHFHVFALDARNHGRSPHDPDMTYEAMVGDVVAWQDRNRLPRTTLVGHSMGGKTAMLLACRHAERVERLIVVDIAPRDYFWIAHRGEFAAMNELDLGSLQSRAEAELRFESRVPGLGMRRFLATNLERVERGQGERAAGGQGERAAGGWRWIVNLPVLTAALPRLEKDSLAPDDRYTGPALFIAGGRSRYVEAADHDAIRRHFPAARIEVIAESGHNPHMDRREEFVRLVVGSESDE